MAKNNTDLPKIEQFKLLGNVTQRAITALGVLSSNAKSDAFFTATDVAEHLITTSKIGEWDDTEFVELTKLVSLALNQSEKTKRQKDLWKSKKKVHARICKRPNIKSAFGYRCGIPIEDKVVTRDDITSANNACKNPGKCDIVADVKNCNDVHTLLNLQVEISARLEVLFNERETTLLLLRDKVATAKRSLKALED